jgi:uncharacterized membrane protein
MVNNLKYKILFWLFIISLASSAIISFAPVGTFCEIGGGCDLVNGSKYGEFFGIKNSHYGIIIFLILSYITFMHLKKPNEERKRVIFWAVIIGSIIVLYFLYLQQFVINAWCKYCLIVDISMIIAILILLFMKEN